jgi:hypothetical protein
VEFRELTQDEKMTVPGMHPGAMAIGAVDEDGKVVAACGVILSPHLDPLWVTEEKRGHSGFVLVRLWEEVARKLRSLGATSCTSSIINGYPQPPLDGVIEHLSTALAGGEELDARIWLIPLGQSDTLAPEEE